MRAWQYDRAPFLGVHVAGVFREKPVMTVEVFRRVLPLAVLGFVEVFDKFCAGRFCMAKVRFDVLDENS